MKTGIIALMLLAMTTANAEKQKPGVLYDAEIIRVLDGDTVIFRATWLPDPLPKQLAVRIYGIDTPEKGGRAQCSAEDIKGQAATNFTTQAIARAQFKQILLIDWDKFGGRVLGDLILDGQSLQRLLIQNSHAKEYYGEVKQSWCK